MIETWKWWMQKLGFMPTDKMQELRMENELLRMQLDILAERQRFEDNVTAFTGMWAGKLPDDKK
jgi:hypothetical protein